VSEAFIGDVPLGNGSSVSLVGDFKEILFADLLQFYCLSGQTAAVSVTAADERGNASTGSFFIDGGVLVDARFDGREGAEAVRRAVRRLKHGAFQVELGARSERRTVHEPWSTLVLEELRQLDGPEPGVGPEPPSWSTARAPTPPAGIRVTAAAPSPHPTPPASIRVAAGVPSGRTPTPSRGLATVHLTPPRGVGAVTPDRAALEAAAWPSEPPAPWKAPTGDGQRSALSRGASYPRTELVPRPTPAPGTAPFSRIRRESPPGRLWRSLLVVGGALAVGGGLAVLMARVLVPEPTPEARTAASPARRVALLPAPAGVSGSELTLGMVAPLSGASKELGRQMKVGLEVAFAAVNAEGGVHGRRVRLLVLDDGYEPERTREAVRELAEQRGVFGFVGNVGTPTAAVALPYALGRQMLFFGSFTGAPLLRREPPDRTVFNYRASYLEETAAIVRYLVEVRRIRPEHIGVLAQDDSYGEAGFQGVVRMVRQLSRDAPPVFKVTYQRNTTDVSTAVARVLERKDKLHAVVMVATYRAAARFIERVRAERPQMVFTNVSFVGSQALAEELVQLGPGFAEGVIVTQVVPLPTSRSTAVLRYQDALATYAPGEKPDFVSLEGYVVGNLLLEGLRRAGRTLTTDALVQALEDIRGLDVGLGTPLAFGLTEHQASHRVWGTVLDAAGNYQSLDLE
jgi:branched-chain amino acid transport system substrate-binding protein